MKDNRSTIDVAERRSHGVVPSSATTLTLHYGIVHQSSTSSTALSRAFKQVLELPPSLNFLTPLRPLLTVALAALCLKGEGPDLALCSPFCEAQNPFSCGVIAV